MHYPLPTTPLPDVPPDRPGYFLDGAGASVARVAGLDLGVMSLRGVTMNAMLEQAEVLCRLCGHWNPPGGGVVTELVSNTGRVTGAYWQEKIALYNDKSRLSTPMRVYGEK